MARCRCIVNNKDAVDFIEHLFRDAYTKLARKWPDLGPSSFGSAHWVIDGIRIVYLKEGYIVKRPGYVRPFRDEASWL